MRERNKIFVVLLPILLLLAGGCGDQKERSLKVSEDKSPIMKPDNYAVVKTYFGTDRNAVVSGNTDVEFGGERAVDVTYGYCNVSIPRDHKMGELESPSIWRLEFRADPERHVVVLDKSTLLKESFLDSINGGLRSNMTEDIFVFVHGYNVAFEDAARRTAQMSYDLGFEGIPIFYSWPSQGDTAQYTVDRQNIEWSQGNIQNFILDIAAETHSENIYLIAHSMGNQGLTKALATMPPDTCGYQQKFKEIILTAPDIDADIFKRDIAPQITARFDNVTLYASSEDLALKASKAVNGYPRAGDSGEGRVVIEGIETIDATGMDTGFLKHSYFAESGSLLNDIYQLINEGKRAEERIGLKKELVKKGIFWRFQE